MRIDIVSVFPEYLEPLNLSLVGKAIERTQIELYVHDLRDFTSDVHRTVDDAPFGGGPGMVMKAEPWAQCIDSLIDAGEGNPELIIPTPSGNVFKQSDAQDLSQAEWLIIACARYEGIDSRVADYYRERIKVRELSIGDYVLAGGEAAALVMVEATARLIPGVLGNPTSAVDDSFSDSNQGLLEGPVYTRPENWRGEEVPSVLLSGNHSEIRKWREAKSKERTQEKRPELLN